jgi:hypothetical protein
MRKTIATVVTLVLVWIGYTAWPLYDLWVLVRAMETHDVGTVTRLVYFDAVRVSLTNQVMRDSDQTPAPLQQPKRVHKLISPEALSELFGMGWPVTVNSDPPPGTVGITGAHDRHHLADF